MTEGVLIVAIGIALVLAVSAATGSGPAGAGKTLARGSSDIWIDAGTLRTSGELRAGDNVSFGFTTPYWDYDGGTGPWMKLQCYKNGGLVLVDYRPGLEGWPQYDQPFTLAGTSWSGGSADCVGLLGHRSKTAKWITEAKINFSVAP